MEKKNGTGCTDVSARRVKATWQWTDAELSPYSGSSAEKGKLPKGRALSLYLIYLAQSQPNREGGNHQQLVVRRC